MEPGCGAAIRKDGIANCNLQFRIAFEIDRACAIRSEFAASLRRFGDVYARFGHVLYRSRAVVLEGTVEQDERRGFSFVVERMADLGRALAGKPAARSRRGSKRIA